MAQTEQARYKLAGYGLDGLSVLSGVGLGVSSRLNIAVGDDLGMAIDRKSVV